MKNLKKVLAMVLAFACTFTMFASAKVYEDVQPGTEFSEAITMLSDLGIIQGKTDGKYHPEETITRAEACALIARLLTGDPNVSNFGGAQNFTDVVKGSWQESAVGYCVANGITVGVGNGKFEPNRAINDQEFLTMLVRALGYETPDMKQGYPFSYMTVANAIGLRENTNMMANTDALRGEDAQVIYNAMFVDYAKGAKMINTTHGTSVEKYPTLAESVWGLNRAALGTWNKKDNDDVTLSNCKAHTWVIIGEAQDEEDALLAYPIDDNDDTDLYKAEEKKHEYKAYKFKYAGDADALRGYKVELWGAGKHGDPVWEKEGDKFVYSKDWNIKAIKTVAGQTKYDYDASKADKKNDNGTIELGETSLNLGSVADNAKNVQHSDEVNEVVTFVGDKLNTVAIKGSKDVEKALNVRNGMQFKLMDWDSDGDIDWIVVDEARYYKVESATSKRVNVTSMDADSKLNSDKDSKTETWKVDETEKIGTNEAKKDVKIKYEVPEGLKEGDIVEVTYKVTFEGKAQLITATVKTVDADNQKLEKVGTKDGLTLTFGDKEVKVAQNAKTGDVIVPANPEKYKDFNGEELGTEFALYKNRNGFIVYSDYATESSNYMMVLNTYGGKDTTGNRDLAVIDFVDANNKVHKDVKVSSSARVLDKKGNTLSTDTQKAYVAREFDESQVVGNVFKYWTDEDGVITKMQAVFDAKDANFKKANEYEYDADADRLIDKDASANNNYVASLEDANVIFAVRENYIQSENHGGVIAKTDDLKVNSADVLATKQKDIPDIGKDPEDVRMLGDRLDVNKTSWMGNKDAMHKFVAQVDKNGDASAAILGVANFNKFAAGQTKLGLVTNVSENSKGVIEAEVAFDGKVETVASVEKQDFEDIVKVFDGREDQDVAGTDARISAVGNNIFNDEKLSELVNQGGQYAEVTVDADGKLTKLVFMDDGTDNGNASGVLNTNKLRGHYYTVSRNLVLNVSDKNLKYHANDNQFYGNDVAVQKYAGSDDKLQTVKRLPDRSAGYASDVKFYTIDGTPTRHDKDYNGTILTVNAGFDNLDSRDIKAAERGDVGYHDFKNDTKKNYYEVADLAFNSDGDLVAVFSFKKDMDQKDDYKYEAPVKKFQVTGVQFAKADGSAPDVDLKTVAGYQNQFVVYVGGTEVAEKTVGLKMQTVGAGMPEQKGTPVTGLTKDNFVVEFGGANTTAVKVTDAVEMKNHPGYYTLTLSENVDTKRAVKVTVVAGGNAVSIDKNFQPVEDKTPEIGTGTVTPVGEYKLNVTNVANGGKSVVVQIVDEKGTPVTGLTLNVPNATVTENGKGVYTITGSATLSGTTIMVNGKPMTLPTLTDGKGASLTGLRGVTYKIESQATGDVTLTDGTLSAENIAAGAKYELTPVNGLPSLKWDGTKVVAKAEELNKLTPGTVKTTLSAGGATLDLTITIQAKDAGVVGGIDVVVGNNANVESSATYDVALVDGVTAGKVLVAVNGEGAAKATEVDLTGKTTSQGAAEAIKDALNGKYAGYTFTAAAKPTRAADQVWTIKVAAEQYKADEQVSLAILPTVGSAAACAQLTNADLVAAKPASAGVAKVQIPADIEAGEWTLSVKDKSAASAATEIKVTVKGTETAGDIALMFARGGNASTLKDKLTFAQDKDNKSLVVITEADNHKGGILEANGVTLTKSDAGVSVDKATVDLTKGVAPTTANDVTVTLTNANEGDLSIWTGASYVAAQKTVSDPTTGVTATLTGKTVTFSGTPAVGEFKFNVGTSATIKQEVTVTVKDAVKPTINLQNSGAMTINVLTADGDASKKITAKIDNKTDETLVISKDAIQDSTDATNATKDGLTATIKGDEIVVTGTPTTTSVTFNVGIRKGAKTDTTKTATVTVTVNKLTTADITIQGTPTLNQDPGKNTKLSFELKNGNTKLTTAQLQAIIATTGHTITGDTATVQSVAFTGDKVELTLSAAATQTITKIALAPKSAAFVDTLDYTVNVTVQP